MACPGTGAAPSTSRTVTFRGEPVATVMETIDRDRVERALRFDGDAITLQATLDARGFAIAATYTRRRAGRVVRAVRLADGAIAVLRDNVPVQRRALPAQPVVAVELLHRLRLAGAVDATLIDLSSAEALAVRIERRGPELVAVDSAGHVVVRALPEGHRTGPGAFAEGDTPPAKASPPVEIPVPGTTTLRGRRLARAATLVAALVPASEAAPDDAPPGPDARLPAPFLESDDPAVVAFARPLCAADALETARRVAEAVKPHIDPARTNEPPSATTMLAHGGDCDGAAALVTAALRACGLPARPLVGYRLVDAGQARARLVPHALAALYTSTEWVKVDATVPALGALDDVFFPVAPGLGGALSMGRLLGVLDASDLVAAPPSATGER